MQEGLFLVEGRRRRGPALLEGRHPVAAHHLLLQFTGDSTIGDAVVPHESRLDHVQFFVSQQIRRGEAYRPQRHLIHRDGAAVGFKTDGHPVGIGEALDRQSPEGPLVGTSTELRRRQRLLVAGTQHRADGQSGVRIRNPIEKFEQIGCRRDHPLLHGLDDQLPLSQLQSRLAGLSRLAEFRFAVRQLPSCRRLETAVHQLLQAHPQDVPVVVGPVNTDWEKFAGLVNITAFGGPDILRIVMPGDLVKVPQARGPDSLARLIIPDHQPVAAAHDQAVRHRVWNPGKRQLVLPDHLAGRQVEAAKQAGTTATIEARFSGIRTVVPGQPLVAFVSPPDDRTVGPPANRFVRLQNQGIAVRQTPTGGVLEGVELASLEKRRFKIAGTHPGQVRAFRPDHPPARRSGLIARVLGVLQEDLAGGRVEDMREVRPDVHQIVLDDRGTDLLELRQGHPAAVRGQNK